MGDIGRLRFLRPSWPGCRPSTVTYPLRDFELLRWNGALWWVVNWCGRVFVKLGIKGKQAAATNVENETLIVRNHEGWCGQNHVEIDQQQYKERR